MLGWLKMAVRLRLLKLSDSFSDTVLFAILFKALHFSAPVDCTVVICTVLIWRGFGKYGTEVKVVNANCCSMLLELYAQVS